MKKRYIVAGIALLGFLLIAALVLTNSISSFDKIVYEKLFSLRSPFFDTFFKTITKFANAIPVIGIVLLLFTILSKNDRIILGSSIAVTVVVNQVLKFIIRRIRPDHLRLIEPSGYSFPSGHAMVSLCLYGICIYFVFYKIANKKLKILFIAFLTFLILLVGISRIYVGVHYPSDVIAGYLLTIVLLILNITILHNHFRGNLNDSNDSK